MGATIPRDVPALLNRLNEAVAELSQTDPGAVAALADAQRQAIHWTQQIGLQARWYP